MSRWTDDALDAHLATFDLNKLAVPKQKQQQQQQTSHAPTASFPSSSSSLPLRASGHPQPSVVPSVPAYLQKPTDVAAFRPYNGWRPPPPARPQSSPAPQSAGGAPLSTYISVPSASPLASNVTSVPSNRPPFPSARFPQSTTLSTPLVPLSFSTNQPTTSNVTSPHTVSGAPVSSAPRHVPLPFPHLTPSTTRPPATAYPPAPPTPAAQPSFHPAYNPPTRPLPSVPSAPSAVVPGFGRQSKPAWLANRSPSPPTVNERGIASPPQRGIGPPPGVNPGSWWKQYHADKAERQTQQKQKRREDGRARRQLLASTRVSRQSQQESAFLDAQFTRYVNQSLEPSEEERRALREESGGWKQRVVERYAHMQCMADGVQQIEHSKQCERLVVWMQRLEELKHDKPTYGHSGDGERSGDKRKAVRRVDKAGSTKKARKGKQDRDAPVELVEESCMKPADDEEDDIPLRPLHSTAALPKQTNTATVDQNGPAFHIPPPEPKPAQAESMVVMADEKRDGTPLVSADMLEDGCFPASDNEDEPVLLNSQIHSSSSWSSPTSTPALTSSSFLSADTFSSSWVDFPDFPLYGVDDLDVSDQPSGATSRISTVCGNTLTSTDTAQSIADTNFLPVSKLSPPSATTTQSEPSTPQMSPPASTPLAPASASVQSAPATPPRQLNTSHPLPVPRSRTPLPAVQRVPHISPPCFLPTSIPFTPTPTVIPYATVPRSPAPTPAAAAVVAATPTTPRSLPAVSASGADVADRELRRSLAAAKREQWLRQHGSTSDTTADTSCPPNDTPPHSTPHKSHERTAAQRVRTCTSNVDVIDLAGSSEDEEVALPSTHFRVNPAPPVAPPAPAALATAFLASAKQSVAVSTHGGSGASSAAVLPASVSVASRSNQPFAAFRPPSVVKDKQRAERVTEQGKADKSNRFAMAEKENLQINLYSQISQS